MEVLPPVPQESKTLTHPQFYSFELSIKIIDQFIEGKSLHAISKLPSMPSYGTLLRWAHDNDSFRERLHAAREVRALHFEDSLLELSERAEGINSNEAAGARIKQDILKWAAEVNNPGKYGKRTTIEGNPDKPITFIIHTGLPPLTPEQTQPKLGSDGLILKEAKEISNVIVSATELEPT